MNFKKVKKIKINQMETKKHKVALEIKNLLEILKIKNLLEILTIKNQMVIREALNLTIQIMMIN